MNTRKRYIVVDSKNAPIRPCDHGLHLSDLQSGKSPSILKLDTAKLFAGKLAEKNKGQRFYVVEVLGGVEAFDVLDGEPGKGVSLSWADASAAGTDGE